MKKVLVSLPKDIFNLVEELKGKFGESNSEVVRTILISFLSEKGYLKEGANMSKKARKDLVRELADELDVFDDMPTALVEILEEKGIVTQEEWEIKIKTKVERRAEKASYRDIQFRDEQ